MRFRKWSIVLVAMKIGSLPPLMKSFIIFKTLFFSLFIIESVRSKRISCSRSPSIFTTSELFIFPFVKERSWSRIISPSRMLPSDAFAIRKIASSFKSNFSFSLISFNFFVISCVGIFLKSNLWHLEIIVGSTLYGLVVAKMNFT